MNNFNYYTPTEIVFGKDTEQRTGGLCRAYGGSRVLVVSGGGSAEKSGLLDRVRHSLNDAGIEFLELKGICPNPTDDKVYEGISICREKGVDMLLAVGGGSVIDTAKAIALGVPYGGDFWDFFVKKETATSALPIGVVLTIPAAGSEGSASCVITRIEGKHKVGVLYPKLIRPVFAVMNPELTYTLPAFQTACGAVDMICHIQERFFSNTPGCDITDGIAVSIMRSVMSDSKRALANPEDYNARANLMWASTLAHNGLCGAGKEEDWATHKMEHEISALYGVAHGAGLAVMEPAWLTFVASRNPSKVREFAVKVMGVDHSLPETEAITQGIDRLRAYYHSLGLTTSLRELIGCEPDIKALVRSLECNMGSSLGFYVRLSMDDCAEIYKLAL